MPVRKKEEPKREGRFCPECEGTLQTSARGWVYCPNKYTKRACSFKGYPAAQGAAKVGFGEDIPELTTASEEQLAIVAYAGGR
jgi:hypothetical protein